MNVETGVGIADEPVTEALTRDPARPARAVQVVVRPHPVEPSEESIAEARADHRSVQHVLERIADRRRLDGASELRQELVVHRAIDDHGAQRRTALSSRAEPAEQRALDGEVEVRVRHHEERVLPAQLQGRRLKVPATQLSEPPPHLRRAGESDLLDEPLAERTLQPLERRRAVRKHHVEHARREPGVCEQLRERLRRGRRILGGLPHHGIPAQQRRHEIPGRNCYREVPRGGDRRHADWVPEREQLFVRQLTRHRHPVEAAPFRHEEVARVDDFLNRAARLLDRLSDLARHDPRQRLCVLLDKPAELLDGAPANGRWHPRPRHLRFTSGTARLHERRRVAETCFGDLLVEPRGVRDVERSTRRVQDPPAVDERGDRMRHWPSSYEASRPAFSYLRSIRECATTLTLTRFPRSSGRPGCAVLIRTRHCPCSSSIRGMAKARDLVPEFSSMRMVFPKMGRPRSSTSSVALPCSSIPSTCFDWSSQSPWVISVPSGRSHDRSFASPPGSGRPVRNVRRRSTAFERKIPKSSRVNARSALSSEDRSHATHEISLSSAYALLFPCCVRPISSPARSIVTPCDRISVPRKFRFMRSRVALTRADSVSPSAPQFRL